MMKANSRTRMPDLSAKQQPVAEALYRQGFGTSIIAIKLEVRQDSVHKYITSLGIMRKRHERVKKEIANERS